MWNTWVTVEEVNTGFLFQSPLGPRDLAAVAAGAAAGRDGKRSSYVAGVLEDEVEAEGDGSIISSLVSAAVEVPFNSIVVGSVEVLSMFSPGSYSNALL